ncbi:MAG: ribonuclease P protein component [Oscillospiraceae bacterium]|jgi:ribonuclease P protein component|nr:ribonuclease P protein component [Oscillospiraceae bacterium]
MQRAYSLKKNRQFQYVYRRGKHCACRELSLLVARGTRVLVGFSISKKVGNSVTRNLMKRRLREIVRPQIPHLKPALYVVVIREGAASASFQTLRTGLYGLMRRQNALREGGVR